MTTTIIRIANIRVAPDADSDKVGTVGIGTAIRLDGRNTNGNWVRGITSNNMVGWLSSGTVRITLNELNGMPIVTAATPFTLTAPGQAAPASSSEGSTTTSTISGDPNGTTVTATANVNLRSGPSTEYRRVGGVLSGAPFTIDGRSNNAYWARGITSDGTIGWAYIDYLSISRDDLINIPAVGVDSPFTLNAPSGGITTTAANTSANPVPVVNTAPVRGFAYGGHVGGFSQQSSDAMHRAGMTWVKTQIRYVPGRDAGVAAGWINDAHARGFRILVGVVGEYPQQVSDGGYYEGFANFVGGVAALGADAIEVWNEPNIDHAWTAGNIGPQQYTELLRQSYIAIKNANPNTMVISAAPAPTGYFGGCSGYGCDDNLFVAGMAQAGAANYMDCIGIHYNEGILPPTATSGDPRGNSGHYTRYFRPMMDTYYNAFNGARPLCFTELGYLSPEGYGGLSAGFSWASNVTVAQQAAWLDQAVSMARNSGRVRLFIIWNVDFENYGTDPMAGYAIIRPGGGCPACDALGN